VAESKEEVLVSALKPRRLSKPVVLRASGVAIELRKYSVPPLLSA